jgi:hypothetical protein
VILAGSEVVEALLNTPVSPETNMLLPGNCLDHIVFKTVSNSPLICSSKTLFYIVDRIVCRIDFEYSYKDQVIISQAVRLVFNVKRCS